MATEHEIESAWSAATEAGNKLASLEETRAQIGDLCAALVGSEAAIDDAADELEAALGPELWKEAKALSVALYRFRNKVIETGREFDGKVRAAEREHRSALGTARTTELPQ
jgi:hypothetical protein